ITIHTENAKTSAVKISNGGGMSNSNSPDNSEPSSGTDTPLVTIGIKNRATVYASIPAIIVDIYATPSVAPTTLTTTVPLDTTKSEMKKNIINRIKKKINEPRISCIVINNLVTTSIKLWNAVPSAV